MCFRPSRRIFNESYNQRYLRQRKRQGDRDMETVPHIRDRDLYSVRATPPRYLRDHFLDDTVPLPVSVGEGGGE